MITSWRIVLREYAGAAFDGEGARLYGGRWNSAGVRVIYTSSSAALAALELLVRVKRREPLRNYILFACSYDEAIVESVDRKALPPDWRSHPAPPSLQNIGDTWAREGRSAVLQVPSAVIETESNYLLNPEHADFGKIAIADPVPFALDLRLLG
ncbi:MAG TPA: RES family NAD+ phosphorylase [Thermoanaerobaculia bacterium]|nr:RES family NAD+ phosphorylase [Thermoanaerobaculia bacterium]